MEKKHDVGPFFFRPVVHFDFLLLLLSLSFCVESCSLSESCLLRISRWLGGYIEVYGLCMCVTIGSAWLQDASRFNSFNTCFAAMTGIHSDQWTKTEDARYQTELPTFCAFAILRSRQGAAGNARVENKSYSENPLITGRSFQAAGDTDGPGRCGKEVAIPSCFR
jgi:hypothetical protein